MKKNFIRVIEDFECENCQTTVKGDGYTNHCPKCLYSKHVDMEVPGDRMSNCLGLMLPIRAEFSGGEYTIVHKCERCEKQIRNKSHSQDDIDVIIKLVY